MATLVLEEDAWQFEATETCTTETQMQDREQELIAVVNYEDPSATETIEAYDARTGEKLDSEEVRKGRAKEKRCESLMNSKSKWRSMSQKCDQHRARKSGQNGLKHERTQTVQQYDVDCVLQKSTWACRDLTRLRQPHL